MSSLRRVPDRSRHGAACVRWCGRCRSATRTGEEIFEVDLPHEIRSLEETDCGPERERRRQAASVKVASHRSVEDERSSISQPLAEFGL
jgi:hypothetical protein